MTGKAAESFEPANLAAKGIVFRPGVPFTVRIAIDELHVSASRQFVMPDVNQIFVLDYSRMPFVRKVTQVGFTDGMLTDFHQTTPSPILGFVAIPKSILEALLPLPGSNPGGSAAKSGTTATKAALTEKG